MDKEFQEIYSKLRNIEDERDLCDKFQKRFEEQQVEIMNQEELVNKTWDELAYKWQGNANIRMLLEDSYPEFMRSSLYARNLFEEQQEEINKYRQELNRREDDCYEEKRMIGKRDTK